MRNKESIITVEFSINNENQNYTNFFLWKVLRIPTFIVLKALKVAKFREPVTEMLFIVVIIFFFLVSGPFIWLLHYWQ